MENKVVRSVDYAVKIVVFREASSWESFSKSSIIQEKMDGLPSYKWNTEEISVIRFRVHSMLSPSCKGLSYLGIINEVHPNICHENCDITSRSAYDVKSLGNKLRNRKQIIPSETKSSPQETYHPLRNQIIPSENNSSPQKTNQSLRKWTISSEKTPTTQKTNHSLKKQIISIENN